MTGEFHTDSLNPPNRVRILNGQFHRLNLAQTVDAIFAGLGAGRRGWLCTVNVSILMMMRKDARLQNFVDRAALVVADGQPLIWCAPWFGQNLPERVTGIDLIDALCERAAREGKRIYLMGASEEVVTSAVRRLRECYANLHVDYADGYFSKDEAITRADQIRATRADILFVGMGVPRQENFIDEQWARLSVGMAIGVGGSFDVIAGLRSRAPVWVQKLGMEWFYRAIQEPRRLFPRYVVTNSQMIWLVLRELLKTKRAG